jgi:lipopolysaccharide/colanic/teichoic acid biosynthesis glycosyltransferase
VAIWIDDGDHCSFHRQGWGRMERPFSIWKLRTMRSAATGRRLTGCR